MSLKIWLDGLNFVLFSLLAITILMAVSALFSHLHRSIVMTMTMIMLIMVSCLAMGSAILQQSATKQQVRHDLVVVQRQFGQNRIQLTQVRQQLLNHPNDRDKLQRSFQLADRQTQLQKQIGGLQTKLKAQ